MQALISYSKIELVIKKSKFLGEGFPINSTKEVRSILKELKEKHKGASHVVHAFAFGENGESQGSSDDGEPQGSAGRPALLVLNSFGLTNTMISITRWFGGILLGRGGLIKAYQEATKKLIQNSVLKTLVKESTFRLTCSYQESDSIFYILEKNHALIISKDYSEDVQYIFRILEENKKNLLSILQERRCTCIEEITTLPNQHVY